MTFLKRTREKERAVFSSFILPNLCEACVWGSSQNVHACLAFCMWIAVIVTFCKRTSVIQFPRNFLGRDPHIAWELCAGFHRSHPPCWRVCRQSRNTSVGVKCDSCDWWYGDAFRLVCTCRLCSRLPDGLSQGEISTSVKILLQRDVWLRSHVCSLVSRSDNVNDDDDQKPLHSVGHVITFLKKYI